MVAPVLQNGRSSHLLPTTEKKAKIWNPLPSVSYHPVAEIRKINNAYRGRMTLTNINIGSHVAFE